MEMLEACLYIEQEFLLPHDQHLITAFSACLTLYIGAHSVKSRPFTFFASYLFHRTIRTLHIALHGRGGAGWHQGPGKFIPSKIYIPLTRKPSILLTLFFSSRISYSELLFFHSPCVHGRRYLGFSFDNYQDNWSSSGLFKGVY
jgi:hypothetical protein